MTNNQLQIHMHLSFSYRLSFIFIFLIGSTVLGQGVDKKEKDPLPTRWFFNTTRKQAFDLSYGVLNANQNSSLNQLHKNIQFWSIGMQYLSRTSNQFFTDDFIRYSKFLSIVNKDNGISNTFKGYQITGTSGLDLIGWRFFDITPLYGYSFGNRKVIEELGFQRVKFKNPFFALILGVDSRFNVFTGGVTGFSLGGYAYYLFDVTRSTWKTKSESVNFPENGKMNGLQLGISLQYIFGQSDGKIE
jgi:hypothetical protein